MNKKTKFLTIYKFLKYNTIIFASKLIIRKRERKKIH